MKTSTAIFNISIPYQEAQLTLTVIEENDQYQLVYNGGIIGGLQQNGEEWIWVEEEQLNDGPLPLSSYKQGFADQNLKLELHHVNEITQAIEKQLQDLSKFA